MSSLQPHRKENGIALVLVLWVMVILTAIVGEFAYSMRTELNITRNFKEEEIAYQLAQAGIEHARMEILSVPESSYPFPYFNKNGILIFAQGLEEKDPERELSFKNGSFSYTIIDEDGKLNINKASADQLKYIITALGVEITDADKIVDPVMDWIDTDDLHRLNGAEEDYYQSLGNPYSCKDGPLDVIEELLLVQGMTADIFYGKKEAEKQEQSGVMQYLSAKNSAKVNVNTASEIVLTAAFGAGTSANIMRQREAGPILIPVAGGTVRSVFFTIISTGSNTDGTIKRSIKAIVQKAGNKLETIYWNDNWTEQGA
ncbi:MAG: general secretion pathway protein GspK [Nitrospirae bacterium]|nr:general secretion pathway protein GspK [Nitrospirota bacterium]